MARYEMLQEIGEGGFGRTCEAMCVEGPHAGQRVCVKRLRQSSMPERRIASVHALRHERRVAEGLRHRNIVTLLDASEDEDDLYLVFELVSGADLTALEAGRPGHKLAAAEVGYVALEVAKGLAYVHQHGLLHRDIKPSNILIGDRGEVKIADFGVAKIGAYASEATRGVGSFDFFSPEQVRGSALTPASDVFSLAVVLWRALVGRHPFFHEDPDTYANNILDVRLQNELVDVPEDLEAVIRAALHPDPQKRLRDGRAMADALLEAVLPPVDVLAFGAEAVRAGISQRQRRPMLPALPSSSPADEYSGLGRSGSEQDAETGSQASDGVGRSASHGGQHEATTLPASEPPADVDAAAGESRPSSDGASTRPADYEAETAALQPGDLAGAAEAELPADAGAETRDDLRRVAHTPADLMSPGAAAPSGSEGASAAGGKRALALGLAAVVAVVGAFALLRGELPEQDADSTAPVAPQESEATASTATEAPGPAGALAADGEEAAHPGDLGALVPSEGEELSAEQPSELEAPSTKAADDATPAGAAEGAGEEQGASARVPLTVAVIPWGNVWVDGRSAGRSPATVKVSPGTHRVRVTNGDQTVRRKVVVADQAERVVVDLR